MDREGRERRRKKIVFIGKLLYLVLYLKLNSTCSVVYRTGWLVWLVLKLTLLKPMIIVALIQINCLEIKGF